MLSQDRTQLLQSFLGSLPEHLAARLAKAVEVDRLMDGRQLPHEMILDGLRPVLRHADRLDRTATPLRLFCRPFEDLLDSLARREKQKASIARSSVLPIWLWVSQNLLPGESASYISDIKKSVLAHNADQTEARAEAFWTLVSNKIRETLASDAGRKSARATLNGDLVVADAEEIALLLGAGAEIVKIQEKLVKPVPAMTEELLWSLRVNYDHLVQTNLDVAPYVAVIAMNRLARPWEALRLPLSISRQTQDTLISKTDMGLVGEILFARMETLQKAILATRHPNFDGEKLMEEVASFAELSSAIVKEIEVRRDGEWGQRLLKDRAAVGGIMDGFMDRAPKEVAAAMPMQKGTAKMPDLSHAVDAEKSERALRYARLIMGSRAFAAAASFAAKQKDAYEEASGHLRRYAEDMVKEMRVAQGERHAIAERQFNLAVELTAILFSEQEAELLRRRGRAAVADAAA
jgi:hypothetical protein